MSNDTPTESEQLKHLMEDCSQIQELLNKSTAVKKHVTPADELIHDLENLAVKELLKKFGHVGLLISLLTHGIQIGEDICKEIKMKHAIDALKKIRECLEEDKATFSDKTQVQKDIDTVDKLLRQAMAYDWQLKKKTTLTVLGFGALAVALVLSFAFTRK